MICPWSIKEQEFGIEGNKMVANQRDVHMIQTANNIDIGQIGDVQTDNLCY